MSNTTTSSLGAAARRALDQPGQIYVDGAWLAGESTLPVINPSTGEQIGVIADGAAQHVDAAVRAARAALELGPWSRLNGGEREALLRKLADLMERDRDLLAELEAMDAGMPLWMAQQLNIPSAVASFRFMAGLASKTNGRTVPVHTPIPNSGYFGYTQREPVGVVAAIIPWNVPVMLAAWKLAPALAAGCTVVLKPSEEASCAVLHLTRLIAEAGFPPGVVNVITGRGATVGAALASHPGIDKITFTGSTRTGKQIAKAAAENSTRVTLELGGKSAQILCADADLDRAIEGISNSIFLHSGQICVSGSRLYVHRSIYAEVQERLTKHADGLKVGGAFAADTQIGPLVNRRQQEQVLRYIDEAKEQGAQILTSGYRVDSPGYFVRPTVAVVEDQGARIVREEVFGPVLAVAAFDDVEQAVSLANDSPYGLAASVWTRDLTAMHAIVPKLRVGKVSVNNEPMPYPTLPEGGRKASGYGRDMGDESFDSYLETKAVIVRYA